ncbi:hypothetical protein [Streptomyces sp. MST-110588]|uniref:hypothetical protein n=1 Tax=Streptomyces sp. MST-110588 TaxID=2833628 RepID=UPI001F5D744A|nr:hypothetical protein [Streptomyces sp. MST-110588]UNO44158.1 hypothetical protein KGS77_23735 [Streptomyces sp. MST-110588]
MKINRRVGDSPRARGCMTDSNCPDIFELSDGRFAVIGTEMTERIRGILPADAGVGPGERIVVVTRETFTRARGDIPEV